MRQVLDVNVREPAGQEVELDPHPNSFLLALPHQGLQFDHFLDLFGCEYNFVNHVVMQQFRKFLQRKDRVRRTQAWRACFATDNAHEGKQTQAEFLPFLQQRSQGSGSATGSNNNKIAMVFGLPPKPGIPHEEKPASNP
jgi:hypothetical protein